MKKSLYQIGKEYEDIASQLEEGELTPELEIALVITQEQLQTKAVNYGFVIKEFESDISAIDEEIKRLTAIKKSKANAKERLKQTLSDAMQYYGIEKVEIPTLKLSFRESKSVSITDESHLPKKYMVEKVSYSPDKTAIKKAIENGENVTGAEITTNQNLQIK